MTSPISALYDGIQEYRNLQETLETVMGSKDITLAVDVGCQVSSSTSFHSIVHITILITASLRIPSGFHGRQRARPKPGRD